MLKLGLVVWFFRDNYRGKGPVFVPVNLNGYANYWNDNQVQMPARAQLEFKLGSKTIRREVGAFPRFPERTALEVVVLP
jgi:hypothetical protein